MRKRITIGGVGYELATNGYTPIAYKQEFGKDYFSDLLSMLSVESINTIIAASENGNKLTGEDMDYSILAELDMTFFHRLFWIFAKSANLKIKPFQEFFMDMEEFPIQTVAPVLMEMVNGDMQTKKRKTHRKKPAKKYLR